MISNPAPTAISGGIWDAKGGIRSITVKIPIRPADNDLAGIIVLGKAGENQALTFPDDVFYKGPWSEYITILTDASNNLLLPNTPYTVGIAAYDEFGTDGIDFGSTTKNVTTTQAIESDLADGSVSTDKVEDGAITNTKVTGLSADKITAGTITGSTLQTASEWKRFVVSTDSGEARFYDMDKNGEYSQVASIGANDEKTVYAWPNNPTGDTDVILTGGAAIKTTPSGGQYGIEFSSTGTAKLFLEDLIPGQSYDVDYHSNCSSGLTFDMGGTAVSAATVPSAIITVSCERPYVLITNSGPVTAGEYVHFVIDRKSTDAIIFAGAKTSTKYAFSGLAYNAPVVKAHSYGTLNHYTAEFRNEGTAAGTAVLGRITRPSSNSSYVKGGLFESSNAGYTGGNLLDAAVGISGYNPSGGTAVLGQSSKPFTDNLLQDGCAAFRSVAGDCDFRNSIIYFKSYTASTLPAATTAGGMIYISNESGGSVMAFSDGTNWRRVTDRAIVS